MVAADSISASVLVAVIGAPAALITAIGTVWFIAKRGSSPTALTPIAPEGQRSAPVEPEIRTNGYRYVTHGELKEIIGDMKVEMRAIEARQEAKFELIVTLLKDR
jgi:hypothetical protein